MRLCFIAIDKIACFLYNFMIIGEVFSGNDAEIPGSPEKEVHMQIGVCVQFDAIEKMDEKLANLRRNDFTTCQILSWDPAVWTAENAVALKALLEKHGVVPSAFWCGWVGPKVWNFTEGPKTLGLVPEEYRAERVQNLCDGCLAAR